jgi:hypothetical protein
VRDSRGSTPVIRGAIPTAVSYGVTSEKTIIKAPASKGELL